MDTLRHTGQMMKMSKEKAISVVQNFPTFCVSLCMFKHADKNIADSMSKGGESRVQRIFPA
jgi:hypothetical protein